VRQHLLTARREPHAPVAASYYAAIADSFYEAEVREVGPGHWIVSRRGDLATVRFDGAAEIGVDFARSRGVIGEQRHAGSLYVALDTEVEEAHIVLYDSGRSTHMPDTPPVVVEGGSAGSGLPYLVESRWRLFEMSRSGCSVKVSAEGFGPGEMVWAGLPPGRHEVVARRGASPLWRGEVVADARGRVSFTVAAGALQPLALELVCRPAS
jgi:hypothetical protein